MNFRRYILSTLFALVLGFLSIGLTQSDMQVDSTLKFKTLQGKTVELHNYTGQITIVNLWSTWSASCVKEMPVLERVYQDYHTQNVKVVCIAVFSDTKKIGQMLRLTKVNYPILIADKKQAKRFGNLSIIPQTFILDANGTIIKHFTGSQPFNKFYKTIEKLIESQTLTKNIN